MNMLKHNLYQQNEIIETPNSNKVNNNINIEDLVEKVIERIGNKSNKNNNNNKKEDLNLTMKTNNSIDDKKLKLIDEIINLDQHNKT